MRAPTFTLGETRAVGAFTVRRIDYPPGLRQPTHFHELSSLTILLSGEIRESARSTEATGTSLSLVVKPAGVRHADEVGPRGARTLQVTFDPAKAADLDGGSGGLGRWRWLHASPAAPSLIGLARTLRESTASTQGGAAEAMEERVIEAVASIGPPDDGLDGPAIPEWLTRVKETLDDELAVGVAVQELARRVGAHPVSVSRAFRRHFGQTVSDYRRRERVRRAAGRLAGSAATISRIAHATGHADHSHLCREFRRITGLTPSEFRRLAR